MFLSETPTFDESIVLLDLLKESLQGIYNLIDSHEEKDALLRLFSQEETIHVKCRELEALQEEYEIALEFGLEDDEDDAL